MKKRKIKSELKQTIKLLKDIEFALNESSIVAITDKKGIIQFANDKFCELSKYSREELVGQDHRIIKSGHHSKDFFKEMWKTIGNGKVWKGEIKNKAKDGSYYWVDTTIVPYLNGQGVPYQYIAIRNDITQRKQIEERIKEMAFYDPLTKLPNRNFLNKYLEELLISHNNEEELIAMFFLDLDRFKTINDTLGHNIGDALLKQIGNRLQGSLRKSGFISRQGGDEFVIVLANISDEEEATTASKEIVELFSLPFNINNEKLYISASIGVSLHAISQIKRTNKTIEECIDMLIKQSDIAMYQAKELGGKNYQFCSSELNKKVIRKSNLEKQLCQALENKEFSIVYQPQVDLVSGDMVGMEALLRWENPELGKVGPFEFIPILEEMGLIIPVGNWVLKHVCEQMKQWREDDVYISNVAVNVSPRQIHKSMFVDTVRKILEDTELPPDSLELEITESTIQNVEESIEILNQLRKLGVKLSIDDFGTGFSSLSYLKKLPIDNLKIDKSFIDELDKDGEVIVKTIIDMGKNLNFKVVAEGVETEMQLSILRGQRCTLAQGYYFSKPISPEQVPDILQKYRREFSLL
ncbi:EAL domain-containing protein [Bacillus sp. V3B]|uniref:sensor domain-containing protein n=1 Tax=Bacillus sp. V3B TaxID=2804915 RepID=UPI00210873FA|nr:EAL domain-containing protein [Bacillus sp. V3B]MCQ6275241.1 EAL domain-containing protein [Bacillus sp. V3B]